MAKILEAPFLRSGFNYDRNAASIESGLSCQDKSLAVQSEKEDADINTIVKRFGLTGQLPSNVRVPSFQDFQEPLDFHQAMNLVVEAQEAFMTMPADIRSRFRNDPGTFMDFVLDPANREESEKLGLAIPPEKEAPIVDGSQLAVAPVVAAPGGSSGTSPVPKA